MRAYIEAQGSLLLLKMLDQKSPSPLSGGVRGRIRGFTSKARARLMRFMARLRQQNIRATFITLTFKGYPSNEEAKRALHAFLAVIRRTWQEASCVWRMEYQKRGSIHFHLLCFNLPFWDWKEILKTWKRITHQDVARIDVRLVQTRRGVQAYVSKYIAKLERRSGKAFFIQAPYLHGRRKWRKGRYWGYHNKKALPLGQKIQGFLTNSAGIKKLSNAAWEIIGSATRYNSISFHLFADNAIRIAQLNIERHGLYLDEWKWSEQLTKREHSDLSYIHKHFSQAEHEMKKVEPTRFHARSRVACNVQPCIRTWLNKAYRLVRLETGLTN